MVTRIVSGVIGATVALAVILWGGVLGVTLATAVLAGVAVFELLRAAGFTMRDRIPAVAAASASLVCLLVNGALVLVLAALYLLYVMAESVMRHEVLTPERAALKVLLPAVAVSGFAAVAALRAGGADGLFYLFLVLVIPWLSDTGAYFTGMCCGKHKLCPVISPKKTVEGFVGGIVVSVAASALTGYLYILLCGHDVAINWLSLLIAAAVGAPLSVCGDLFASVVKRRYGVKDYGNIMPGHGGVMDRFDSVLPVAIWLLLWVQFWPIV
ncbi:MAG: hypothetical protein E7552_06905 [Ruminococcaceae bacterium]|nr:hypothetical protein [Oscillospiraceae bacterium]